MRPILDLIGQIPVRALAHITGGGLYENLPRVMPPDTRAVIDTSAWPRPVFDWIQGQGAIAWREMHRTFNCGIGMVAVVAEPDAASAIGSLSRSGETAWRIGTVVPFTQGHGERVVIEGLPGGPDRASVDALRLNPLRSRSLSRGLAGTKPVLSA